MKRLNFRYHLEIDFDIPVKEHRFTLKCIPYSNSVQQVESLKYNIVPNYFLCRTKDSFENESIYGSCDKEHNVFSVDVWGNLKTGLSEKIEMRTSYEADIYKYQTEHTKPGEELKKYSEELKKGYKKQFVKEDILKKAIFYMHRLYEDYTYESGITEITTTAEEAFKIGKGVCQDYSHILIALLRMERIPCRYVTGMMLGEGYSHAWIELCDGNFWIAIDPTNDLIVKDCHIRIAVGRDYKDCMINQGVFIGCGREAKQRQDISVTVEEIK